MLSPYFHLSEVRGVIFDWDGVIAETKLDFSPIREKYFHGRRVPLIEAAEKMDEPLKSEYLKAIRDEEMRGAWLSTPVEGALEFIDYLEKRRIPWCIHSRNCYESVIAAAQTINLALPEHVLTREAKHVKPDPLAMVDAAQAIGVPKASCLVIGDFLYELQAARRAGMRGVLLRRDDAECASYADAFFDSLTALHRAFLDDTPLVPWEYHGTAARYSAAALKKFSPLKVHFDEELNSVSLKKLDDLAALGIGEITVSHERDVAAQEIWSCAGLNPYFISQKISDALRQIFSLRYPLLTVSDGDDGIPSSSIADAETFAQDRL